MLSSNEFFVVIIGCGRLGSYLANRLSHDGHSVVVVDNDESAFELLSDEYSGFKVEGDATEISVLKEAKLDEADWLVAATREDNINLMVAQIAKEVFHVKRVIARDFEPERETIYQELDIETVCPTTIAGDVILESLFESLE